MRENFEEVRGEAQRRFLLPPPGRDLRMQREEGRCEVRR